MFDIPAEYKPFVNSIKRKCKYHNINFVLSPSDKVLCGHDYTAYCSGFFDNKNLVVACAKPVEDWMEVLVHESCHLDQFLTDKRWDTSWNEPVNAFWSWLDKKKMLNKKQLHNAIDQVIDLELDCEKRAVEKIIDWGLPIKISKYIQNANSYLYSYRIMADYQLWPVGIYDDEKVTKSAPKTFQKDYRIVPPKLEVEIHRFYNDLKNAA